MRETDLFRITGSQNVVKTRNECKNEASKTSPRYEKKPGIPGFFDGSGDWIRTNDRSGMKAGEARWRKV